VVRVGIIGGGFGAVGLLPAFRSIQGCETVELAQPRSAWPAFLERADLDAVAIAVPPNVEYDIAKAAIERGLHVFAEKPLAANLKQARELLDLADANGVVHCVDFMFPDIPEWREAKAMLDRQTFGACRHLAVSWTWLSGDLRYDRSSWRTDTSEGGGVLSHHFSHGLHYLEHFAGRISAATSQFAYSPRSRHGAEVGVDLLLAFESGAKGTVHVSANSPGRVAHRLVFECDSGVIVLENRDAVVDNFQLRTFSDVGEQVVTVESESGHPGDDERVKIVRKVAQRFVDACTTGGGAYPSFEDGVRVHELIEQLRRAVV
jgi:predicted dehydrogenase